MKALNKHFAIIIAGVLLSVGIVAQTPQPTEEKVNFGYSRNPPSKTGAKPRERVVEPIADPEPSKTPKGENGETTTASKVEKPVFESVAKKTREIAKEESFKSLRPTEIYKVGAGDVLLITLQESKSNYFTVLDNGSIDYPLAGGLVSVSGLTPEEIEDVLRAKVQLYENPEIHVKVREHSSHGIDVLGLVDNPGKQYLQREAMPLYVVRAQALARTTADVAVIKRNGTDDIVVKSGTPEFDETLIVPGDVVEFVSNAARASANGFVYVSGAVSNVGRFGFVEGMTLTQAVIAAGGLSDEKAKKAVVRRKNAEGYLDSATYKLADIKKGKAIDPVLVAGDMIEVEN